MVDLEPLDPVCFCLPRGMGDKAPPGKPYGGQRDPTTLRLTRPSCNPIPASTQIEPPTRFPRPTLHERAGTTLHPREFRLDRPPGRLLAGDARLRPPKQHHDHTKSSYGFGGDQWHHVVSNNLAGCQPARSAGQSEMRGAGPPVGTLTTFLNGARGRTMPEAFRLCALPQMNDRRDGTDKECNSR